jgi:hypothetical protein
VEYRRPGCGDATGSRLDLTLPGGVSLAIELMPGRDPGAGMRRQDGVGDNPIPVAPVNAGDALDHLSLVNPLSSWMTRPENQSYQRYGNKRGQLLVSPTSGGRAVSWYLAASV